jgi:glutathione S-transferase
MRLYYSPTSPYARKVQVLLREKGLQFEAVNVRESREQALAHNPFDKVPTVVLDDGTALFDSRVITETLDALYPTPRFIPEDTRERALVRRWEALGDGLCDVLMPVVVEEQRPEAVRNQARVQKLEAKSRAVLTAVEAAVEGRRYLHRDAFSLADIAIVSALGYVNLRRPDLLAGLAATATYIALQLERPSFAATVPPNLSVRS